MDIRTRIHKSILVAISWELATSLVSYLLGVKVLAIDSVDFGYISILKKLELDFGNRVRIFLRPIVVLILHKNAQRHSVDAEVHRRVVNLEVVLSRQSEKLGVVNQLVELKRCKKNNAENQDNAYAASQACPEGWLTAMR